MTHSMRKSTGIDGDVYTIGIWTGSGWNSVRDFDDAADAAAFANYLNGGDGKPFKPPSENIADALAEPLPPIPEAEPEIVTEEPAPAEEPPAFEPEPWETEPRPTISAQRKLGTKRPKR